METDKEIVILKIKIILLAFVFNPGAIVSGLALYGIFLETNPFDFISFHDYSNSFFLVVGVVLLFTNLYFIFRFEKQKKLLEEAKKKS